MYGLMAETSEEIDMHTCTSVCFALVFLVFWKREVTMRSPIIPSSHHPTLTKSHKGKVKVKSASTGQGYRGSYAFGGQPDIGCRVLTTNIVKQKKSPKQAVGTEVRKREKIQILENMDINISPIIFKYYVKNNTCT